MFNEKYRAASAYTLDKETGPLEELPAFGTHNDESLIRGLLGRLTVEEPVLVPQPEPETLTEADKTEPEQINPVAVPEAVPVVEAKTPAPVESKPLFTPAAKASSSKPVRVGSIFQKPLVAEDVEDEDDDAEDESLAKARPTAPVSYPPLVYGNAGDVQLRNPEKYIIPPTIPGLQLGAQKAKSSDETAALIAPLMSAAETAKALGLVVLISLPVLLIGAALRIWEFGQQSAYMDEASYIITGRTLLEQGSIYANALQWTFGSLLYPILAGWFDTQGGLLAARGLSVFFGLVTILATIFLTLGLFKAIPENKEKARADYALFSRPVIAALLAGLLVAVLPTPIALSRFATYDAMAAGLFVAGAAFFVWARREVIVNTRLGLRRNAPVFGLFFLAAVFLFGAFLTKYVVALYFPAFCLLLFFNKAERNKGLLSFILPLSLACAAYFASFSNDLTNLLQFGSQYKDLRSNDVLGIYVFQRPELILMLLVAYWGVRQAFKDGRGIAGVLLLAGTFILLVFQFATRADYDWWKHSIYMIVLLAPLIGWQVSDWYWWDRYNIGNPNWVQRKWAANRAKNDHPERLKQLDKVEHTFAGWPNTERPGSYSLGLVLAGLLVVLGVFWGMGNGIKLVNHWPSVNPALAEIRQASRGASTVLVDDSAMLYYLYNRIPTDNVTTPFFINYKGESGRADAAIGAYRQAIRDQVFSLIILDGGVTPPGKQLNKEAHSILLNNTAYTLVYSQPLDSTNLDEPHTMEIYKLLSLEEQKEAASRPVVPSLPVTTPAPAGKTAAAATPVANPVAATATAVASAKAATTAAVGAKAATTAAVTVAPTVAVATPTPVKTVEPTATPVPVIYPTKSVYNFANGDEGWGAAPPTGPMVPGKAVSSNDTYKMEGHASLRFTPQPAEKIYSVGVLKAAVFSKISVWVYIPADKADTEVRMGVYYLDNKWEWHDDGFQLKVTPGRWTELKLDAPALSAMQQFGVRVVGFSGTIYLNGVVVE